MKLKVQALTYDGITHEDVIEVTNNTMVVLQVIDESVTLSDIDTAFRNLTLALKYLDNGTSALALPYGVKLQVVNIVE